MTSRERVRAVLAGDVPDRPPTRLRTTIEALGVLEDYLHMEGEALLLRLGIDLVKASFVYAGPDTLKGEGVHSAGEDIFGIERVPVRNEFGTYYEIKTPPLGKATSGAEVEDYPWPSPDWFDYDGLPAHLDSLICGGERAVMLFGGELETPWLLRGLEMFMVDLFGRPDIVEALVRHVTKFFSSRIRRALDSAGDRIDIVGFSGDVGSQRGMLFSPDMWRRYLKPQLAELMTICHDAGAHTFYHSCGSIVPIIPDLIEIGVDILDPIQTQAEGMAPEALKERFGNGIIFHGGVDEQELLPRGSPEEVAAEVRHLFSTLGRGGGYILSSSHDLQPDTPPENIVAMFDAAKQCVY